MTHSVIARSLLSILCGGQGLGTLMVDINRTHATNPKWTGHARYHLVWQATSYAMLSLLEMVLIVTPGPLSQQRFYLAAILACIPILGFFGALISRGLYGGTLSDPNGIQPARFVVWGTEFGIDLSLVAETLALLLLMGIVGLFVY
jgi:hypothetical protein